MSPDVASAYTNPRPLPAGGPTVGSVIRKVALHSFFLLLAAGLFAIYEHLALHGQSPQSLGFLFAAAVFGFAPVRAVLGALLTLEGKVMHLFHGIGGLLLASLPIAGVVGGGPVLTHAAMAPFAIMGAAQALMHQNHPRDAQQAAAIQRFASSLPEIEQFTRGGNLTSPENAARAIAVLTDLIAKAQALGETELRADPGFQSALRQATTRFGLTLGLDATEKAIAQLAANPAAAGQLPALRKQLERARRTVEAR